MRPLPERESSRAFFNQCWHNIRTSSEEMSPELFLASGMEWYRDYTPHRTIPGVWVHQDAPQSLTLPDGKLGLFLAAPSNSGKDAIRKYLQNHYPGLIYPVVTATDRPKFKGEIDGVDQIFLTTKQFLEQKASGKFIEASQSRFPFWFGIPAESIQKAQASSNVSLFRINLDGVRKVRKIIERDYFPTIRVAIVPNVTLEWYRRMLFDSGKPEPFQRYETAKEEMFRIGQRPDTYEYLLINPWNATGAPHEAGESLQRLLQQLLRKR